MISNETYVAGTRFGMGIRPDEVSRISSSPQGWLEQQIISPLVQSPAFGNLQSSAQNMRRVYAMVQDKNNSDSVDKKIAAQQEKQEIFKEIFRAEYWAKLQTAVGTPTPFYERLVNFWSNHFAVSMKKGPILRVGAFAYEREAIRPFVMGKFENMLQAVVHHPAMLHYLDNAQSIGPDSRAGQKNEKGLNENLAREIMELHTLGVNGGYTQQDVTTFAKVITGWTIAGKNKDNAGGFEFNQNRHEPGTQVILGKSYPDTGETQGMAVLHDLARNPKTAHHLAFKLARHFIADEPPEQIVMELAHVYMETGGDLPSVYKAIIGQQAAWDTTANPKIKSTMDLVVSALRAAQRGEEEYIKYAAGALQFLGTMPFTADSPAGFPDVARDMIGPESMIQRVEWAQGAANRLDITLPPMELASITIGPIMTQQTQQAIAHANNPREAIALLFGSPEFQRR